MTFWWNRSEEERRTDYAAGRIRIGPYHPGPPVVSRGLFRLVVGMLLLAAGAGLATYAIATAKPQPPEKAYK